MPSTTTNPRTAPKQSAPPSFWLDPVGWVAAEPLSAGLHALLLGVIAVFFYGSRLYSGDTISALGWAWSAWNKENNYEHATMIAPICLWLVWRLRADLARVRPEFSAWGVAVLVLGVLLFLVSVRTSQPRVALACLPVLLWGAALAIHGPVAAKLLFFPIFFFLFAIPIPSLDQATFQLQFIITGAVSSLLSLLGLQVEAVGTTLMAKSGAFNFEVAGGCSGVRSLMAMTMLTALYVYTSLDRIWKQVLTFIMCVPFAIIGNIARVVSIVLFARFIDKDIAGGFYHDNSGFIFFPIALSAMVSFGNLLNWTERKLIAMRKIPRKGTKDSREEF